MTRLAVADFGIAGDGVTDSTDGFLALRAHLLTDRDRMWEVEFPPGHYLTRAPHWLSGIGRGRLIGYGATLQQMNANRALFAESEPFRTLQWTEPFIDPMREHHPGFKIASIAAGEQEVRFLSGSVPEAVAPGAIVFLGGYVTYANEVKTSALGVPTELILQHGAVSAPVARAMAEGAMPEAVVPGAIVFLGGYVQQTANNHLPRENRIASGWPPNLRFFEYALVRGVAADSVSLARPLRHAYDETWWDYPGDYFGAYMAGAPRLYLCNRRGFDIPLHIEMLGFSFARAVGSGAGAGHIGFKAALHLHLEDCVIQDDLGLDCFVQMNDRVTLRRCKLDDLEIDKCLRHVLVDDCDIGGLTSDGAGALEVEVRRSRIYGDFRVNPRTSVAIDNATAFRNFSLNAQHGGYYDTDPFVMTIRATRP